MASFEAQVERDKIKAQLCREHGVKLIAVPHTISLGKLEPYLRDQLRILGYL